MKCYLKSLLPRWIFLWVVRWNEWANFFPHMSQVCFFSPKKHMGVITTNYWSLEKMRKVYREIFTTGFTCVTYHVPLKTIIICKLLSTLLTSYSTSSWPTSCKHKRNYMYMVNHVCSFHTHFSHFHFCHTLFIYLLKEVTRDHLSLTRILPGLALLCVAPSFLGTAGCAGFAATSVCPIWPSLLDWGMQADIWISRELASGKFVLHPVQ